MLAYPLGVQKVQPSHNVQCNCGTFVVPLELMISAVGESMTQMSTLHVQLNLKEVHCEDELMSDQPNKAGEKLHNFLPSLRPHRYNTDNALTAKPTSG